MIRTRFRVLYFYLFNDSNGVSFYNLLSFFFDRSYNSKAKNKIKDISLDEKYYKVFLDKMDNPLYYPKEFKLSKLDQVLVESLYPTNWHYYEIEQTKVCNNDIVIDCGAAEGLFGLLVANRCQKLYMIEPLPAFCKAMEKTFQFNDVVEVLPVAISNEEKISMLSEDSISSTLDDSKSGIEVNVTTLDKLFFEKGKKITFIKMDLEGFDYEALLGAENLIRTNKPKIAVTTYHKHEHAKQISDLLKSIVPEYKILTKGIYQETGCPIMLHAWV